MLFAPVFINFFFILAISLFDLFSCYSNGVEDEITLMTKLTENIPKYTSPYDMFNNSVNMYTDIMQILSINEKEGSWQVRMWLAIHYKSENAAWNRTVNGKKEQLPDYLLVPSETFWTPDIGNLNQHLFFSKNQYSLFRAV